VKSLVTLSCCVLSNKCLFIFLNDIAIEVMYIDFDSFLLHVLAVYFSQCQIGILDRKKSEKGENA
jgi:hypothetical protein